MTSQYEKRVVRVLRYIHDNPGEDLSLDRLADVAAMSRFHWHRVFHAMTGETCAQAVRRLRLFRAAGWLVHEKSPIADIAARVGYPNVNSFIRAFRDGFGVSPAAFRKQGQLGPPPKSILKGNFKMFEVNVTNAPKRRLAAILNEGAYSGIGSCFEKLVGMATTQNYWPKTQGMIGVHYDDPNVVKEPDLRAHAGLLLIDEAEVLDGLEEVQLDGGNHAVLRYKGPYEAINIAYDHLFGKWLPSSGQEPADAPCYELYLNNPADTAPEELLTEIYLPLAA